VALLWGVRVSQGETAKAISFVFSDLDGHPVRLADYRGKWVLVSFWAPWCPLCKIQVPNLNKLNLRKDFRVIGVALDYGNDEGSIRKEQRLSDMRYEATVAGGSRKSPNGAARQVGPVDFFPTSYLYDPTGEIVMFIPGQLRMNRVLAFMEQWRAERGKSASPAIAAKTEKLASLLRQRYGEHGVQAYAAWKQLLDATISALPTEKLAQVNDFFNRRAQADAPERADHWATPGEVLGGVGGGSADLAIAKYFTLLALNLAPEQMRLVYVASRATPVHLVLAWYPAAGREPLLLDDHIAEVLPASRRPDLRPIYSFNSLGVWEETATAASSGDPHRLAVWEDTLRRARAEGFE
jgi:predicted transglutaminase-like cysteine proteinase/thiol-disulfide isomerase/thioredoxin